MKLVIKRLEITNLRWFFPDYDFKIQFNRDVVHIKLIWPAADVLFKSQNYDAYFDEIPDNFFRYFVQSSFMKPSETISLNNLLLKVKEFQRIKKFLNGVDWS